MQLHAPLLSEARVHARLSAARVPVPRRLFERRAPVCHTERAKRKSAPRNRTPYRVPLSHPLSGTKVLEYPMLEVKKSMLSEYQTSAFAYSGSRYGTRV